MTASRPIDIAAFLEQYHWDRAHTEPLTGDFSTRRYARLTQENGATAFLMDADPDQKTPQFLKVDSLLREAGLSAPEIYAADANAGLVLMEDFGARNIGALLDSGEAKLAWFLKAAGLLAKLHKNVDMDQARDLPVFNTALFVSQAELFLDAYVPYATGRDATAEERDDFRDVWSMVLRPLERLPQSLLLRDFMADNLVALPNGELGVLDFQDAGIGPIAYDLASLCEEVRRDGGYDLLPQVVELYREAAQSALSQADLMRACTTLSAQRHTRILGIFARLSATSKKDKIAFLPRVQKHLERLLKEPHLAPVQDLMEPFFATSYAARELR